MPGIKVSKEHLKIIYARYLFASRFISGKTVLEVGCGPGLGLGYFFKKAKKVVGIDISEENLSQAKRNYRRRGLGEKIEIYRMDAHNLSSFKEHTFDVVVSMATVYALNLDKFLKECRRVLKRKGFLVFCLPNKDIPGFQKSKFSTRYYSVPELTAVLSKYKFNPKIFGAFPIKEASGWGNRRKLKIRTANFLNRVINLMPGAKYIKNFLDSSIRHKIMLKPDIKGEDIQIAKDVQFTSLNCGLPNSKYEVLYVSAQL